MSDEETLRRMLHELRAEFPSPRPTRDEAQRAARHVAFMDEIVERKRRSRRVPLTSFALAASVLLAAGAAWFTREAPSGAPAPAQLLRAQPHQGSRITPLAGVVRVRDETRAQRVVTTPEPLRRGDELRVPREGRALLQLENGSRVELAEITGVRLDGTPRDEVLHLESGRVDLAVPGLKPQSLSVVTRHARVTVVGTRFSVTVDAKEGAERTCVEVFAGSVAVATASSRKLLTPGATWSSDGHACGVEAEPSSALPSAPTLPPARARPAPSAAAPAASAIPEPAANSAVTPEQRASLLAEQNRLFASALRARERGELRRARELFQELAERFPDAALTPQAQRELHKLERPQQRGAP